MDEVELEIYRVHGLTDKTDNRGSIWIKFDLGYSKDEKTGLAVHIVQYIGFLLLVPPLPERICFSSPVSCPR